MQESLQSCFILRIFAEIFKNINPLKPKAYEQATEGVGERKQMAC